MIIFLLNSVFFLGSCSCNAESIEYLIKTKPKSNEGPTEDPVHGRAVVIIVGGAAEAFKSKPGTYYVILNRRKGFVKLALKNGLVSKHYFILKKLFFQ